MSGSVNRLTNGNTQPSTAEKIGVGFFKGVAITLLSSPFVNGFNRASTIACKENCSSISAIRRIYSGALDNKPASFTHFLIGMKPYLWRETTRVFAKSWGLTLFKPELEKKYKEDPYGALKTNLIFSTVLSGFDVAIHPLDTCANAWYGSGTLKKQFAGKCKLDIAKELYSGAGINGGRQWLQWLLYATSEEQCSQWMETHTKIDPHKIEGIAMKSFLQSFLFIPLYPLHRCKIELQNNPELLKKAKSEKKYRAVVIVDNVLTTQGKMGLWKGVLAKVASNFFLMIGASILLQQGRKALKQ